MQLYIGLCMQFWSQEGRGGFGEGTEEVNQNDALINLFQLKGEVG